MDLLLEPTDMGWRWTIRGDPRYTRALGGMVPSRTEAEERGREELAQAIERERTGDTGAAEMPSPVIVSGIPGRERAEMPPQTPQPVAPTGAAETPPPTAESAADVDTGQPLPNPPAPPAGA